MQIPTCNEGRRSLGRCPDELWNGAGLKSTCGLLQVSCLCTGRAADNNAADASKATATKRKKSAAAAEGILLAAELPPQVPIYLSAPISSQQNVTLTTKQLWQRLLLSQLPPRHCTAAKVSSFTMSSKCNCWRIEIFLIQVYPQDSLFVWKRNVLQAGCRLSLSLWYEWPASNK